MSEGITPAANSMRYYVVYADPNGDYQIHSFAADRTDEAFLCEKQLIEYHEKKYGVDRLASSGRVHLFGADNLYTILDQYGFHFGEESGVMTRIKIDLEEEK